MLTAVETYESGYNSRKAIYRFKLFGMEIILLSLLSCIWSADDKMMAGVLVVILERENTLEIAVVC